MLEEAEGEADVPAQYPEAGKAARLSASHANPWWSSHRERATPEGSRSVVGLIGRIRDRGTFDALRREGRRARRGPVTVMFLPGADGSGARVAYSVGRHVGSAVARNRVRRRLRAVVRELDSRARGLAAGAYLVIAGAQAADAGYAELRGSLTAACDAVTEVPG